MNLPLIVDFQLFQSWDLGTFPWTFLPHWEPTEWLTYNTRAQLYFVDKRKHEQLTLPLWSNGKGKVHRFGASLEPNKLKILFVISPPFVLSNVMSLFFAFSKDVGFTVFSDFAWSQYPLPYYLFYFSSGKLMGSSCVEKQITYGQEFYMFCPLPVALWSLLHSLGWHSPTTPQIGSVPGSAWKYL